MESRKNDVTEKVKKTSEGVLSKAVDLALVSIYFGFEASLGGYTKVGLAGEKAVNDLAEVNYNFLKRSISYLKRKGLVQTAKEGIVLPAITEEGKKRLKTIIPQYDNKRVWDRRVYIITYDLPREKNTQRNILRDFLRKIGCGSLQYSVWLTPYNPKRLIEEFVDKHNLDEDMILISSLGKDGTIGDMDLRDLMDKVYNLIGLNDRYKEFINNIKRKVFSTKEQVVFSFLLILKNDPQIPFSLLPDDWVGDRAYQFYKNIVGV